jgi:hypothetical protein
MLRVASSTLRGCAFRARLLQPLLDLCDSAAAHPLAICAFRAVSLVMHSRSADMPDHLIDLVVPKVHDPTNPMRRASYPRGGDGAFEALPRARACA